MFWKDKIQDGGTKEGFIQPDKDKNPIERKEIIADIYSTENTKESIIVGLPIKLTAYFEVDQQKMQHTDEFIFSEMSRILAGKVGVKFPLLVGNIKEILQQKEIITNLSHPDLRPNTILLSYKKDKGSKSGTALITVPSSETRARLLEDEQSVSNKEDNVITE
jgi:hypothetical protein